MYEEILAQVYLEPQEDYSFQIITSQNKILTVSFDEKVIQKIKQ